MLVILFPASFFAPILLTLSFFHFCQVVGSLSRLNIPTRASPRQSEIGNVSQLVSMIALHPNTTIYQMCTRKALYRPAHMCTNAVSTFGNPL